jgi:hypothetical protein
VIRRKAANSGLRPIRGEPLFDQFAQGTDKGGVSTSRGGSNQLDTELAGQVVCLFIQVVEHFHVIRDKAYGREQHVFQAARA